MGEISEWCGVVAVADDARLTTPPVCIFDKTNYVKKDYRWNAWPVISRAGGLKMDRSWGRMWCSGGCG